MMSFDLAMFIFIIVGMSFDLAMLVFSPARMILPPPVAPLGAFPISHRFPM